MSFSFAGKIIDCYTDPDFYATPGVADKFGNGIAPYEALEKFASDRFALNVESNGTNLRYYPTYNKEITQISWHYFQNTGHQLPEEMQKVAAANLKAAHEKYGLEVPEVLQPFEKMATNTVVLSEDPFDLDGALEELAQEELFAKFASMPLDTKLSVVQELMENDRPLSREMQDYVPKDTISPMLSRAIGTRSYLEDGGSTINCLLKMASASKTPAEALSHLITFDRMTGIMNNWSERGHIDPVRAVYGVVDMPKVEKVASDPLAGMSAVEHLHRFRTEFPKTSSQYSAWASADPESSDEAYLKARNSYTNESE